MAPARQLEWDGLLNARDLGGIALASGGRTAFGRLIRSDGPDHLSERGWQQLWDYGVRTVIDLRNPAEIGPDGAARPSGLRTVEQPLDGIEDREFWDEWELQAPPLYYQPFLERFPERTAAVMRTIADAPEGAVLFHCVGGRDRTGMIALLLLRLAGATDEDVLADYLLSIEHTPAMYERLGMGDVEREIAEHLAAREETSHGVLTRLLGELDAESYLLSAGVTRAQLDRLRARLTG
jgi:protein-tyrosine phosphatase